MPCRPGPFTPGREGGSRDTGPLYSLFLFLWPVRSWNAAGCREKVTVGIEPSCLSHVHVEGEHVGAPCHQEPSPQDGLRLGEAKVASFRAGKLCAHSYPPAPPPQPRREGLPPWRGTRGTRVSGQHGSGACELWEGPPGEGCRVGSWESLAGWGIPESPWLPGAKQAAFPCLQPRDVRPSPAPLGCGWPNKPRLPLSLSREHLARQTGPLGPLAVRPVLC